MKSELKIIEAGFYKKALISQDFGMYSSTLVNAWDRGKFNDKGTAFLISSNKNHKFWFEHIKRLMNNPSLVEDLGERLYESVKDKYHLKTTTEKRKEFYKQLINK
jgi:glycosyltransferase involved in cell wall biosynthesis